MARILKITRCEYGGLDVLTDADPAPLHFHDWRDPAQVDARAVDSALAERQAVAEADARRAAIESDLRA